LVTFWSVLRGCRALRAGRPAEHALDVSADHLFRRKLDRVGTPDGIVAAISFLVGQDSGYVTGQTLNVDGGLYMH
jgi:NAD(P)-dependent dehydrogenase (short-subunit alcohol dehydrogenase family)